MNAKSMTVKRALARICPFLFFDLKNFGNTARIALTFDDGPDPVYTPKVLDVLKKYGVPATFFFTGRNIEQYSDIVVRAVEEGHSIGGHGYDHVRATAYKKADYKSEIDRTFDKIKFITGSRSRIFRPPYGTLSLPVYLYCSFKGIKTVMWSVDSKDFEKKGEGPILNNILTARLGGGEILLFHDENEATVTALPQIIESLKSNGFIFVKVT